jgi:hypothetical protein
MSEDNSKVFFVPHDFDSASFIRANFKWIGDKYFANRVDGVRYSINKNQDSYPKTSLVYNKIVTNMDLINQEIEDLSESLNQEYIDNILRYNKSYFEFIKRQ